MKALVLVAENKLVYKDVPDPVLRPNEVLVDIKACGICGSDVHGMDGSSGRRIPPVIMGHEASGVITARGRNVPDTWKAGDRVTFDSTIYPLDDWYSQNGLYNLSDNRNVLGVSCNEYKHDGAFAEKLAVPHYILHKIPANVSFNHAAMTEPLSVALHAVNLNPVSENEIAVVIGTGIIGLFVIQVLRSKRVSKIIAVDQQQDKLELAKKLGATEIFNVRQSNIVSEIQSLTNGRGADIAYEAVGAEPTVNLAVDAVRKGGSVTLIGNIVANVQFPLQKVVTKQLHVQGSCAICGEYPQALNMIANKDINLDEMISAIAPLVEGSDWFKKLYNNEEDLLKIILNP